MDEGGYNAIDEGDYNAIDEGIIMLNGQSYVGDSFQTLSLMMMF